ncbi:MAG: FprA family A-type flavoprotein [Deltaproteobacteria bacterium]|nr:FprA family A-type flavoprotein [Candidatus Anaeroferrophillacea bacterium]
MYASRTGNTRRLAEAVAAGIEDRLPGTVMLKPVEEVGLEELRACDALAVGSPTYFRDIMDPAKRFLFLAEQAKELEGRPGAAFTTYGWGCDGLPMLLSTMEHILGLRMFKAQLAVKEKASDHDLERARRFGAQFAGFVVSGAEGPAGPGGDDDEAYCPVFRR